MRVFISHSHQEKPLVRELEKGFHRVLRSWIDEERLHFGCELGEELRNAIDTQVDCFLLLLDHTAVDSEWVRQEVSWALEREAQLRRPFLVPVLLDEVRHRFSELGLSEERLAIRLPDREKDGVRLLAERISDHLIGLMSEMTTSSLREGGAEAPHKRADKTQVQLNLLLDSIPDAWRAEVRSLLVEPVIQDLATAQVGIVPLNRDRYYRHVFDAMRQASPDTEIIAVSTLSSDLWSHDADQLRYEKTNFDAVRRGAVIRRLFIVSRDQENAFDHIVRRQTQAGIIVRAASTDLLANVPQLEDFVLFDGSQGSRAFVADPGIDGSRRIRSGALILSELALAKRREAFSFAWALATPALEFFESRRINARPARPIPPGLRLKPLRIDAPVVTCEEAAKARGIPLANELKTLLLRTQQGVIAAHVPGDALVDFRKVKTILGTAEAYLLEPEELIHLRLSPGTVCAILDPIWSMKHLVSPRVLELNEVATNNGTLTGYFVFSPKVLLGAARADVGDLER